MAMVARVMVTRVAGKRWQRVQWQRRRQTTINQQRDWQKQAVAGERALTRQPHDHDGEQRRMTRVCGRWWWQRWRGQGWKGQWWRQWGWQATKRARATMRRMASATRVACNVEQPLQQDNGRLDTYAMTVTIATRLWQMQHGHKDDAMHCNKTTGQGCDNDAMQWDKASNAARYNATQGVYGHCNKRMAYAMEDATRQEDTQLRWDDDAPWCNKDGTMTQHDATMILIYLI